MKREKTYWEKQEQRKCRLCGIIECETIEHPFQACKETGKSEHWIEKMNGDRKQLARSWEKHWYRKRKQKEVLEEKLEEEEEEKEETRKKN